MSRECPPIRSSLTEAHRITGALSMNADVHAVGFPSAVAGSVIENVAPRSWVVGGTQLPAVAFDDRQVDRPMPSPSRLLVTNAHGDVSETSSLHGTQRRHPVGDVVQRALHRPEPFVQPF